MSTKKLQIIGSLGGGASVELDSTLTKSGKAADAKAVGDAIANSQANWDQTDETAIDFIKNKPDEDDAKILIIETGLIDPVTTASGEILTDKNGTVIIY